MSTPVESLLNIKRWGEDEAKNRFALALKELAVAEERLLYLQMQYEETGRKLMCVTGGPVTMAELARMNDYREGLFVKIELQHEVITEKERQVESARLLLAEASKERKTFERLNDKQKEARDKEARRVEQIGADEHAVTGHTRKTE
jgi:flagellar FliJ protein